MLVGGVVVENGVDDLAGADLALDSVEDADELLMGVLLHAAAKHRAIEHVEGGEQGGGAVSLVVVGHGPTLAGLQRQAGLGTVERPCSGQGQALDLALLVDREHDRMRGRMQVEADNVLDFLGEGGVPGALEGAPPVRLKVVRLPDALDGGERQVRRPWPWPGRSSG